MFKKPDLRKMLHQKREAAVQAALLCDLAQAIFDGKRRPNDPEPGRRLLDLLDRFYSTSADAPNKLS